MKNKLKRAIVVALALGLWFWSQSLIGKRDLPPEGIGDQVHIMTTSMNGYFEANRPQANVALIVSSLFIDLMGLYLLGWGIFGPTIRPILGLLIIFSLRQICQAFTALPPPPHMIWHDPGFPSLLVTYGVSTDLFFSGHTAIAVFAVTELARFKKTWLTITAGAIALFEIVIVLILRAHYTMDILTAIAVAFLVASHVDGWAKKLDNFL